MYNNIFDYEFKNIYHILEQLKAKRINIDIDKIHKKDEFINFFILFFEKFEYNCKIEGKDYLFENELDKTVLLEYLRSQRDIKDIGLYDEIICHFQKMLTYF